MIGLLIIKQHCQVVVVFVSCLTPPEEQEEGELTASASDALLVVVWCQTCGRSFPFLFIFFMLDYMFCAACGHDKGWWR